jgi:hypothetical protein
MNLSKEASKLLTNKYFLYFIVFLTAMNLFGYLATNKYNAIVFFILVSLLTYQFSKNMTVILLVALASTSFLLSSRLIREGMENNSSKAKSAVEKAGDIDPQIKAATKALNETGDVEKAKQRLQEPEHNSKEGPVKPKDPNNPDLNAADEEGPQGAGSKKSKSASGPRLDYAATLEESYKNLDNILGGDSIQKLTSDTQKLMAQQQSLFNTMNKMVPVLEGAQNMLKGFDMNSLSKSLQQVGNLGDIKLPQLPK